MVYATDLFDEATAVSLADRLVNLLEALADDPSVPVGDVALLDEVERVELVPVVSGAGVVPVLLGICLPRLRWRRQVWWRWLMGLVGR